MNPARHITRALLIVGLAAAGCGGKGTTTDTTAGGGGGGSAAPVATQPDAAAVAATGPLNEADCTAMIGHIMDLGVAEQRKTLPPEQVPTPGQVAAGKKRMVEQGLAECLQLDRPSFACVMAAQEAAALETCAGSAPPAP